MTAEEYWKSKYPEVAMPKTNHEKYVNDLEKAAIWEFAEAYHREKMEEDGFIQLVADLASQEEREHILGIIEELRKPQKDSDRYAGEALYNRAIDELIEKIKG